MTRELYIHIDADAFFASVEQCIHKELRGKPVVTGRDGSIAVALSYEAKALGVKRATPIHLIKQDFPSVHMVSSDYSMYRLYSQRMLNIIKEYIPQIKQQSIDECSSSITSVVVSFVEAEQLAYMIQEVLETKLSCTFSFGISTSPLLAKLASGLNKPSGVSLIDPENNTDYLKLPISSVSGLGVRSCEKLSSYGITTINHFIEKYQQVAKHFPVVIDDIYKQLQGIPSSRNIASLPQQSMNRARSFKLTNNKEEVRGQMVANAQYLLRKMRAQDLVCQKLHVSLKNAEHIIEGKYVKLEYRSRDVDMILAHLHDLLEELWDNSQRYRHISVTISSLSGSDAIQADLFGNSKQELRKEKIYTLLDALDVKFGESCVSLGSTLLKPPVVSSSGDTTMLTERYSLLPGESLYKRLKYPFLGLV